MLKMFLITGTGGFLGSGLRYLVQPLYEAIVYFARKNGLAGATVLRGIMSYGANSMIHTAKLYALSDDLPIIIEIVDEEEKIQDFIEKLQPYFERSKYGGLVTLENIRVIYYKGSR